MVKLGSTLESSRKDKRLANSDNIYDKRLGKMQEEINQDISSLSPVDEEDLTRSFDDNGRSVTKFADRSYSPQNFSGKGYKILRKNIKPVSLVVTEIVVSSVPTSDGYLAFIINGIETHVDVVALTDITTEKVATKIASKLAESMVEYEVSQNASTITLTRKFGGTVSTPSSFSAVGTGVSCSVKDSSKTKLRNLITPAMINEPNTIYEIRYDFDLDGESIEIQEGTVLKFEGGILRNGTITAFKIYLEKCSKENFHDIEFIGIPYIDNNECTTKLDVVDRNILFQASVPFTSSLQDIIECVEPARDLGINHFQYIPNPEAKTADKQIEIIEKLKLHITSIKTHNFSPDFMEWFNNVAIPIVKRYEDIKYVYINNESRENVSDPNTYPFLIEIVNKLHSIRNNIKVGVSTNYHPSAIAKPLYEVLDCIGINYYPRFPYLLEKTTLDTFIKNYNISVFQEYCQYCHDKEVTITEFGCIPFYECAFNPADWQLINKFNKIHYDSDLIYTTAFYDLGFYIVKNLDITYFNIWYNETLGKYRRYYKYIRPAALEKLYNNWLKI